MDAGRSARLALAASSALLMQASSAGFRSGRPVALERTLETCFGSGSRNAVAKLERPECLQLSPTSGRAGRVLERPRIASACGTPNFSRA